MIQTPLLEMINQSLILDYKAFFMAIKENRKRGSLCHCHDFSTQLQKTSFSHTYKYQCTHCGFLCDYDYKTTYELGFKHGKEDRK